MTEGKPTLQHLNNSQSQQILWLLEELGIEYNLNLFERQTAGAQKNRAPEVLKETHPLGKAPQLITPEGRVIIERAAISKYLIDKYDTAGKFKPNPNDHENDEIKEEEWMSFGGSSFSPILMIALILKFMRDGSPFFVRPLIGGIVAVVNKGFLNKEIEIMVNYMEDSMKDKQYFLKTDNPTRVDFAMCWYFDLAIMAGQAPLDGHPKMKAWYERCKARDAWKRALAKGNGYDLAVKM